MKNNSVRNLTMTAFLVALGILIPMVMPARIVIGDASFTLASHVPVMLAMFFNIPMAIAVALGTTFGFFINGLPPVVGMRALSHVVFVVIGAWYLQQHPKTLTFNGKFTLFNPKFQIFNVVIGIIHATFEVLVALSFNMVNIGNPGTYQGGALYFYVILMGVGGLVHSLVDFNVAYFVGETLSRHFDIPVFSQAKKLEKQTKLSGEVAA